MRLLSTLTYQFQEFFDSQRPPYAILSHTWGHEETSYLDLLISTSDISANLHGSVQALLRRPRKDSEGLQKIAAFRRLARSREFQWVWVDSCCIDKSSSAELSEAINSMWAWYRDAAECYVYLADISLAVDRHTSTRQLTESLGLARWFTRGWTLQELLAPKNVFFCNSRWEIFAQKAVIGPVLSAITKIPLVFLDGTYNPADCRLCSAAMKMSWLARRETTRDEDMAYCMLGLFDVHMPLIYGEGRKAFMRLQLEIIKKIDDHSIFAWTGRLPKSGLLATWPTAFANSGNIVRVHYPEDPTPWLPAVWTSLGLEVRARYRRHDPHQHAIDQKLRVQTISTALARTTDEDWELCMRCGPCGKDEVPIAREHRGHNHAGVLILRLRQFGPTWQRVNCTRLEFQVQSGWSQSQLDAYMLFHVDQQGI